MQQLMNVIRRSGYGYGDSLMTNEGYYVTETAWFRAVNTCRAMDRSRPKSWMLDVSYLCPTESRERIKLTV